MVGELTNLLKSMDKCSGLLSTHSNKDDKLEPEVVKLLQNIGTKANGLQNATFYAMMKHQNQQ
jgi:hypothetical protein